MDEIADIRQEAAALSRKHARAVAEIRESEDLTADAKKRQIREVAYASERKMAELREKAEAARTAEYEDLRGSLVRPAYPNGATVSDKVQIDLAYQQYLDRALEADGPGLSRLLARAFAAGNRLMARAALEAAFVTANGAVIDEYVRRDPGAAEKVDRLVAMTNRDRSADAKFRRRMEFSLASSRGPGEG